MKRRRDRERGQGTVEFVFVSLMVVLFLMLSWQMAWVGCQKWYFNFVTAYAARAWSVTPTASNKTPADMMLDTELFAAMHHTNLVNIPLIKLIFADEANLDEGSSDDEDRFGTGTFPPGIRYKGYGQFLSLFQPETLQSAGFEAGGFGVIRFETYIPIEHEESFDGPENQDVWDNDRS